MSHDQMEVTPEVMKVIKNAEQAEQATFGNSIDFDQLFRVKGHKRLYFPITKPQKNGVLILQEFLREHRVTIHIREIQRLGGTVFFLNTGETIELPAVFDNLYTKSIDELLPLTIPKLMDVMVPDYDPDRFKEYHAKKVIEWYLEIKTKIDVNSKKENKPEETIKKEQSEAKAQ